MILYLKSPLVFLFCIFFIGFSAHAEFGSEYTQKTTRLNGLEKTVAEGKSEIKALLKALAIAETEAKEKALFEEVSQKHVALQNNVKEYNKLRLEIKYKFPKKNDETVRRYLPMREQSLDEIENETGLDSVLTRVKNKIDQKYQPFLTEEKEPTPTKVQKKSSRKDKPERLRIEK